MKSRQIWRRWTPQEIETAARLYAANVKIFGREHTMEMIAREIGRTPTSVNCRLSVRGRTFDATSRRSFHVASVGSAGSILVVPDRVIAERDRARDLEPRDLTAALCGDPLPGRSALDRRRAVRPEIVK